jgi:flavin reductase (DIM6/NTAB) family NADH-FMN oxidoreductase RutF
MGPEPDIGGFIAGFDYPMYVVTVASGPEAQPASRSGCLVGFATQCSIDPACFLVCISKQNHTYRVARDASVLGLHVLGADQRELAELFGGRTGDEVDKFASCSWRDGPRGVPVLTDCPRWMVAEVVDRVDLGDHAGFLLAPVEVGIEADAAPLKFSQIRSLQAGHPA